MSERAKTLMAALMELPEAERLAIAEAIYDSLPCSPGVPSEDDPNFDAILEKRVDDIRSGRVVGKPVEEVMARLRDKYAK